MISRVLHPTPTGVDRVEMAYARGLIARTHGTGLSFAALHPAGLYGRLPESEVLRFLDRTEHGWMERDTPDPGALKRAAMATLAALRPRIVPRARGPRVYLQSSPHHLDKPERVAAILAREEARFAVLVHDLIPIDYPEYARPGGADQHRRRVATIAAHADGIIANSAATLASIEPWLGERTVARRVALLGADDFIDRDDPPADLGTPYFLCIGTIEPRKNHLLLLNLWRRFAAEGGPVPRLVLVGRRGWENENVVDMLERCPGLAPHVEERGTVPDRMVRRLIRGARALLLPSFAEGYGMPVAEALAMGTPVICSDLPALREAGGAAPDYLDPLDGIGWARAIRDYAGEGSPRRAAQAARIGGWTAPRWAGHLDTVLALVQEVADRDFVARRPTRVTA
nr:glycosyltransferase family 1 protein [Sphingomonas quercus]